MFTTFKNKMNLSLLRSRSLLILSTFIIGIAVFMAAGSVSADWTAGNVGPVLEKCNSNFTTAVTNIKDTDTTNDADGEALYNGAVNCVNVDAGSLGFKIPTLGDILTFAIRVLFVVAGLAALFYLLLGAFAWVTSGGDKDAVTAAREKIQAAVIGMILIVGVLAIIWTLEQVIFNRRICLGLSCSLTLPGLIVPSGNDFCCVCVNDTTGDRGAIINTSAAKCNGDGTFKAL